MVYGIVFFDCSTFKLNLNDIKQLPMKHFRFQLLIGSLIFFCNYIVGAQTPFYVEDFSSGAIPDGWSTTDVSGNNGKWEWCDNPEGSSADGCAVSWELYSQQHGDFKSSTAENGFMIMDSDGLGDLPTNHVVQLTSAPLNCEGHTQIWIKFESLIGVFENPTNDLAVLKVSTDKENWTEFNLFEIEAGSNGYILGEIRWSFNPHISVIPIPELAAGQSTVYLQWEWEGNFEYYWMIDDLEVYGDSIVTDIDELQRNENLFSVYPNPVSEELNISVSELWPTQNAEIEIFDLMGNVVLKKDIGHFVYSKFPVDVSHLPTGQYFIQLKTSGKQQIKRFSVFH